MTPSRALSDVILEAHFTLWQLLCENAADYLAVLAFRNGEMFEEYGFKHNLLK